LYARRCREAGRVKVETRKERKTTKEGVKEGVVRKRGGVGWGRGVKTMMRSVA